MPSRRGFLAGSAALAAGALGMDSAEGAPRAGKAVDTGVASLCGDWRFRTDAAGSGEAEHWYADGAAAGAWDKVAVPHTWQIDPRYVEYRGVAWYRREFDALPGWQGMAVRVEFEAVFHSARVWVNGTLVGEHLKKGYTAFQFDVTRLLRYDRPNVIAVRVDNAFNEAMLPRGRSSDWAHDGGIFRPVQLLITPEAFVEAADVDTVPDFAQGSARLDIAVHGRNAGARGWKGTAGVRVIERETGLVAASKESAAAMEMAAGGGALSKFSVELDHATFWHFDHPALYELEVTLGGEGGHRFFTSFGVRKFEVKGQGLYLNNERVRLMGVERMAGSNPEYGMAEPESWIVHDHDDLKYLNCVFTRVHWPQDKRVLDYCDEHGILIQTEVPAWGPNTFAGMTDEPSQDILESGIEQLHEMVARDRNHPCIGSWGVCNEINGQNPPAYAFAKRMYEESKKIDPGRLVSYASHSLFHTPGKDVAGVMDFVMMNEYYGSWQKGGPEDLRKTVDGVHAAFPDKPIVISEYGYCACTADRPEGDQMRREVLASQDAVFRERDYMAGLIFFCYNDYRTHVGDRGLGVMRQRVHGVVDLYGAPKASYELLRTESSPIAGLKVEGKPKELQLKVMTRAHLPSYVLRGYKLRGVYYGFGEIPVERKEIDLPDLVPGQTVDVSMAFSEAVPLKIEFDILRPTGFSAYSQTWKL